MISDTDNILGQKMLQLLEENENYKNENLDLYSFSKLLGVSPRAISNLVSECFKIGFREFLNQFRVKKAVELIHLKKNTLKVNEYAGLVGYKSRITFFNAFKNQLGMSPEQFIKKVSISKQEI
ncbi:helix-turn-helix domain-containing protein [Belliella aquatica]|uniref:HTH araC/xylS-type domain-containing protein n=1 Tax=Belliella aquatica TaxID=1323734 RepID=A0ABQ1MZA1_9BACT|nr:helix-turn-helix domain-containing protein [Belliella aquatica]MCH7407333.1 helix-turn-helix domain-containing protein [Belliella aquatica]GGC49394.1 hypothetical protein GCM10010993_29840 [Belliella aquatica]